MLIDITSFTKGPRQIENAVETPKNPNQVAVEERVNGYIEFLQSDFLRKAVGKPLCEQIDAYSRVEHMEATEEPQEGEQQEGSEETQQEVHAEPNERMERLISLLSEPFADYVFFHMLRDMNTQATITGLVRLKCANDYVSTIDKGVQAWNRMADALCVFVSEVDVLGVEGVHVDRDLLTYINNFNL